MTLLEAQRAAEKAVIWLAPFCDRIEIAGSIRRLRPVCNDIDLVVIPKYDVRKDLLGVEESRENLVRTLLVDYVRSTKRSISPFHPDPNRTGIPAEWITGKEPEADAQNLLLRGRFSQLDIWIASEETFATRLITRTGSREHNIWISNQAFARHGKFKPYEGLWLVGPGLIQPKTEHAFYEALGLAFIAPEKREAADLMRIEVEAAR